MTEAEWLASDDPKAMLDYLLEERHGEFYGPVTYPHRTSDRKLRLLEDACYHSFGLNLDDLVVQIQPYPEAADFLREIVGNPFRPVMLPAGLPCRKCRGKGKRPSGAGGAVDRPSHRPCEMCKSTGHGSCPWLTPDVLALAQAAYDDRDEVSGHLDPVRLLILADSLEEAGCPQEVETACNGCGGAGVVYDEVGTDYPCVRCGRGGPTRPGTGRAIVPHPLLAHLRSPGPHVRGCWAIDLILGKE